MYMSLHPYSIRIPQRWQHSMDLGLTFYPKDLDWVASKNPHNPKIKSTVKHSELDKGLHAEWTWAGHNLIGTAL